MSELLSIASCCPYVWIPPFVCVLAVVFILSHEFAAAWRRWMAPVWRLYRHDD